MVQAKNVDKYLVNIIQLAAVAVMIQQQLNHQLPEEVEDSLDY
jgi:hypothetical protein